MLCFHKNPEKCLIDWFNGEICFWGKEVQDRIDKMKMQFLYTVNILWRS